MQHHRIARSIARDRHHDWQHEALSDRRLLALDDIAPASTHIPTSPQPTRHPQLTVMARIAAMFRLGARA
jgi:hypothetical protein